MNCNKEMENILMELKKANKVPKLLLHSCCAPCSSHVISVLTEYFDITILYYNPNIEPFDEYEKRFMEAVMKKPRYRTWETSDREKIKEHIEKYVK